MLTKGAIGNLVNRYRAVLRKCHLINVFGSLAVASMLVLGGAGMAEAEIPSLRYGTMDNEDNKDSDYPPYEINQDTILQYISLNHGADLVVGNKDGSRYDITINSVGSGEQSIYMEDYAEDKGHKNHQFASNLKVYAKKLTIDGDYDAYASNIYIFNKGDISKRHTLELNASEEIIMNLNNKNYGIYIHTGSLFTINAKKNYY